MPERTICPLVATLILLAQSGSALAATPAAGELTDAERTVSYRGGPFIAPNRTDPVLGDGATLQCVPELAPCDDFALTVALPADFLSTHPDTNISVKLAADNGTSDYDLYVV